MKSVVIFGNGGHSKVIASFLPDRNIRFVGLQAGPNIILEKDFFAKADLYRECEIYLGIGDNKIRSALFQQLQQSGFSLPALIAPHAFVAKDAKIGAGSIICAGAIVGANATIGQNCIVNTLSSVDHDCTLGDHGQLTAGVILGGASKIGTYSFFGIRSATIPNITVGDYVTVMAGSLVTKNFSDHLLVGGSPATIMRENQ